MTEVTATAVTEALPPSDYGKHPGASVGSVRLRGFRNTTSLNSNGEFKTDVFDVALSTTEAHETIKQLIDAQYKALKARWRQLYHDRGEVNAKLNERLQKAEQKNRQLEEIAKDHPNKPSNLPIELELRAWDHEKAIASHIKAEEQLAARLAEVIVERDNAREDVVVAANTRAELERDVNQLERSKRLIQERALQLMEERNEARVEAAELVKQREDARRDLISMKKQYNELLREMLQRVNQNLMVGDELASAFATLLRRFEAGDAPVTYCNNPTCTEERCIQIRAVKNAVEALRGPDRDSDNYI